MLAAGSALDTQEQANAKGKSNVHVFASYQITTSLIPLEQTPTAQQLAFREKLRREIERLKTILADGTYTEEDQENARASLRAAGIIDENDDLMPKYQPISGEE